MELAQIAFGPFSVGPEGCGTRPLPYVELMLALGWVLWEFEVRVEPGLGSGVGEQGVGRMADGFFDCGEERADGAV